MVNNLGYFRFGTNLKQVGLKIGSHSSLNQSIQKHKQTGHKCDLMDGNSTLNQSVRRKPNTWLINADKFIAKIG